MHPARMLRVAQDLSTANDLPTLTAVVRSAARELTGADGVTVVLRERDQCFYADEDAIGPLWKGRRFRMEQCISGWAMLHDSAVVLPDIYKDPRIPHDAYRSTFVKSLAMVPVGTPSPIAAIGAYWASHHEASAGEIALMRALADSTAVALANVQQIETLRASLRREQQARVLAESATAAKDEFLALVVHELRQPLHASLAALRMMQARASREQGEHAREVVDRQLRQMNRLVEDLLDAARIVRGHGELRRQEVDVTRMVRHVADSVQPLMAERWHDFVTEIPQTPIVLDADHERLQQVLMNLLTNAAKYTDPGGRVRLGVSVEAADVLITVADTGRGIPPELLPRVFDLFTRAGADSSGFGVGLAVSRRLVQLHGGTIEAHSDGAGRGSVFTVRLPRRRQGGAPSEMREYAGQELAEHRADERHREAPDHQAAEKHPRVDTPRRGGKA